MKLPEILQPKRKKKRLPGTDVFPEIPTIGKGGSMSKKQRLMAALEKGGPGSGPQPGGGSGGAPGAIATTDQAKLLQRQYNNAIAARKTPEEAMKIMHAAASRVAGVEDKHIKEAEAAIAARNRLTVSNKADIREKIRKAFDPEKHPRNSGKFDAHTNPTNKVFTLKDGTRRIFVKDTMTGERHRKYWKPGEPDVVVPKGEKRTLLKKALSKGKGHPGPSIKPPDDKGMLAKLKRFGNVPHSLLGNKK
jgi:hypothetical protein